MVGVPLAGTLARDCTPSVIRQQSPSCPLVFADQPCYAFRRGEGGRVDVGWAFMVARHRQLALLWPGKYTCILPLVRFVQKKGEEFHFSIGNPIDMSKIDGYNWE
jgi:hypothetical protein